MARTLRIATGIVLFVFVATHLLNMSIGLVSLEALDAARSYFMAPWSNPIGFAVLAASMIVHGSLGLVAIYWRNTLRMTRYDMVQTISALLIIPLLVSHVMGVTLAERMLGFDATYQSVLHVFWLTAPAEGLRQVLVVAVTWIHGCIGLFTWMRLHSWWPKAATIAYPLAVLIPVSALLGFVEAGNQVIELSQQGYAYGPSTSQREIEDPEAAYALYNTIKWTVIWAYLAIVAAVLVARRLRLRSSNIGILTLRYLSGDTIRTDGGVSLLEAAHANDLPHADICKGRGRCGTCRVRIISSSGDLPPPAELEQKTLDLYEAGDDVRLACQLVPASGEIELERVLPPDVDLDALVPPAKKSMAGQAIVEEPAT